MQKSNWIISPGIGVKIKNIWNHHPVIYYGRIRQKTSPSKQNTIKFGGINPNHQPLHLETIFRGMFQLMNSE